MKRLLPLVLLMLGIFLAWSQGGFAGGAPDGLAPGATERPSSSDEVLAQAFAKRSRDLQVEGRGRVQRVLSDDDQGSRHQRFLLELESGQVLLVVHNIDLAPRIETIRVNDRIEFFGEYEWNDRGGLIHWTHSDPGGRHVAGWLKHAGRRYP